MVLCVSAKFFSGRKITIKISLLYFYSFFLHSAGMQNLAIACAMVCLILLGSAILVGLFGIFRTQISAVLVTGVIYVLAALFAIFTLAIVHVKHRNRADVYEPLDVWIKLIPDLDRSEDFRTARKVSLGWSLQLAWAGVGVCAIASMMWMSLSKMMRYNPISLVT